LVFATTFLAGRIGFFFGLADGFFAMTFILLQKTRDFHSSGASFTPSEFDLGCRNRIARASQVTTAWSATMTRIGGAK
jgi:hypothetical protein